ncbi:MAG: hypothetical protein ONA90_03735 [candidate division KSB1 bacterium]|nr:hypothetical protein [candidate division KSB1 bacterium]
MDKRAQASLTYRIVTEVLGFSLVLGAFSLSLSSPSSATMLIRNLVIFAIAFAALTTIWWRLGAMFGIGLLGGRTSAIMSMIVAFNIALAPVFLGWVLSDKSGPIIDLAAKLFTFSFIIVFMLMAFLVNRSRAYQNKSRWRYTHHSLWLLSGFFILSFFVPLTVRPLAEIPARFILWAVALAVAGFYQRLANYYANAPSMARQTESAPAAGNTSGNNTGAPTQDQKPGHDSRNRSSRHRRGRYRGPSGPPRRRV